jgi:uncharacterized protein YndB with AHSA1/START domain
MKRVHVRRTIPAPPQQVFDWLTHPANLTTAPLLLRARYRKDSPPPGVGAVRQAVAVGMWVRERITAFDPPHSYSYLIVRSVPAFGHEGGTVTCEPAGAGTLVEWTSTYRHPWWVGGPALEALTAPLLQWNFGAVLAACGRAHS